MAYWTAMLAMSFRILNVFLWSHCEKLVCIPRVLDMLDLLMHCMSRKAGSFHKGTVSLVPQAQSAGGNHMTAAPFSLAQLLFCGFENTVAQTLARVINCDNMIWCDAFLIHEVVLKKCPVIVTNLPVFTLAHNQLWNVCTYHWWALNFSGIASNCFHFCTALGFLY